MAKESLHEKEQLEKLEKAAAEVSEPEHIERQASADTHERKARFMWTLPYLAAAALAGGLLTASATASRSGKRAAT